MENQILQKIGKIENIIINQPFGIKEILFLIPLMRYLKKYSKNIIIPTFFTELQKHFPDIIFIKNSLINIEKQKSFSIIDNTLIIPFRYADIILNVSYKNYLAAKYRLLNLPFIMWRELKWERDIKSENKLFYEILKLNNNSKYNLINEEFEFDFPFKKEININNNLPNINMEKINGFTLLDWGKVIENATNIYTTSTSLLFLLEILDLKAQEVHIYKKIPIENTHDCYNYLITKNFIFE